MTKVRNSKGDSDGRVTLPRINAHSTGAVNKAQESKPVRALYPSEKTTMPKAVLNRAVTDAIKQRAAHK